MYEVMEHMLIGSRIPYLYSMVSMVKCRLLIYFRSKVVDSGRVEVIYRNDDVIT